MSKRSHGDGSIQKRGENSWRLRYYVGDVRHSLTFRGTRKQAADKLRGLLADAGKGVHVVPDKKTLSQWADDWIALKTAERQHKTVARYEDNPVCSHADIVTAPQGLVVRKTRTLQGCRRATSSSRWPTTRAGRVVQSSPGEFRQS
jgi:hypothetical protein